jgi:geranylgeranyl pyrophosphate synthase/SAM-dependent methyltransferase
MAGTTKPSRESAQFADQVNRMFDRVAARYDLLNSLMSAGLHHRWRERAADQAGVGSGDSALDVCCGTGDLTLELAKRVAPDGHVVGCDFSEPMLDLARDKAGARGTGGVRFEWADALSLPYDAGRFDAVTVGFGLRNFADRERGLREMARVLRPAARLDLLLALVRPDRADPRPDLRQPRGLRVPGRVGPRLPGAARPGRDDGSGRRAGGDQVHGPRRRHRHDPHRHRRVTRRSAVPPPVTAVLDASSRWLPARLGEVEQLLREQTTGHGELLDADAGSTLSAGGKRLRPLLVLLCAGAEGGPEAVRAAAAVELVHMATLVHDDVLDAAPLRRGQPTVFSASGRERAVGTGDLLLARSFALLAEAGDAHSIELLAAASVALARGELAQRQDAFDTTIDEARYMERCALKTAALFSCAVRLGRDDEAMAAFGASIGLAFQLLDDVLDVSGPPERTGKARGTDLLDGTVTLPLIAAARRDPTIAATDLRGLDAAAAEALCERIAATGALEDVRSRALEMVAEAKERLAGAGLDPEQRHLLDLVADGVVQRYS